MAYNTFFIVSICLGILGFWNVLEPISCYQFSAGLIKMDPCLITSYETIKHRFLIFWVLQQLFCHLHPRTFLLIGKQMGDPASTYLCNLFFRMKWTDAKLKFVICISCLTVKGASFSIMNLSLLMLDLVIADLVIPE